MAKQSTTTNLNVFQQFVNFMRADGEAPVIQREDEQNLKKTQVSHSTLTSQFMLILTLSSSIASFGLMADSAVAVVGAMLIAPLMKPILAYAYGIVSANWRLQLRAAITMFAGVFVTMIVAGMVEKIIGLRGPTEQIMARTEPSLIDLGVAIAAGVAASLATTRRNIADALPGVAIAVALVPPLCVAGIGFAEGTWEIGWGATLLFGVNLVAIVLAAATVFFIEGYGHLRHASRGLLLMIVITVCVLSIPLSNALRQLRTDDQAQATVEQYLHEQYPINHVVHPNDLSRLDALWFPEHIFVFMELKASQSAWTEKHSQEVQKRLTNAFGKPVNLKVQLLLSYETKIYPHRLPNGELPDYGQEDLIPRR